MDIFGVSFMMFLMGISIFPRILMVLASQNIRLYLICGSIGMTFIKLSVKIFTSDGKLSKSEVEKLDSYMVKEFGKTIHEPLIYYLNLNKQINEGISIICRPISQLKLTSRIDMVYQLFLMVSKDCLFNDREEKMLKEIAKCLRLGEKKFSIIKGRVIKEKIQHQHAIDDNERQKYSWNFYLMDQLLKMSYNPYATLGIEQNVSNEDLKKAYRNLVKKYHPDRAMQENYETRKNGASRILEINEAYETIKKMRGLK